MKRLILFLSLALGMNGYGQTQHSFIIKEFIGQDSIPKLDRARFMVNAKRIFEDDSFVVSKTCSGEWGGTIKFTDKKTRIEYSAASTCPVVVHKLNGRYFVTNTLAHLIGFSEILEIADPRAMAVFKMPKPRKKKDKTILRYVGDDESKSTKGVKQLIDSIGVLTIATFVYKEQLYHIVTDREKTYLTKIAAGRYETIDTISSQRLWTYDPEVFTTEDNHSVVFFENQDAKGYFDIYENTIIVVREK